MRFILLSNYAATIIFLLFFGLAIPDLRLELQTMPPLAILVPARLRNPQPVDYQAEAANLMQPCGCLAHARFQLVPKLAGLFPFPHGTGANRESLQPGRLSYLTTKPVGERPSPE